MKQVAFNWNALIKDGNSFVLNYIAGLIRNKQVNEHHMNRTMSIDSIEWGLLFKTPEGVEMEAPLAHVWLD